MTRPTDRPDEPMTRGECAITHAEYEKDRSVTIRWFVGILMSIILAMAISAGAFVIEAKSRDTAHEERLKSHETQIEMLQRNQDKIILGFDEIKTDLKTIIQKQK